MGPSDEPILSRQRDSMDFSSDSNLAEEDGLLTGRRVDSADENGRSRGAKFWRELGLFAWALLATAGVIVLAVIFQKQHQSTTQPHSKPSGKRNLIFMVSDGMGPTSLSLTRSFRQLDQDLPIDDILVLDKHMIGQSRTRSSSSLVTDSAAGATAFACGFKSYNGAISVLPDHSPCGTVLEAAKMAGYMTGLVVTTRITDATPACFAAHVHMRSQEDLIAEQMVGSAHPLGRVVDLMIGGGRCHFLPNSTDGSCRDDDKDVVSIAEKQGYSYIDDRAGFDALKSGKNVKLPLLGLIANKDVPYEIDRRNEGDVFPSLDEMAKTALRALSDATRDSDQGFFLMIEGSRIDHAGHGNDPAAQVHEVLAYDKAFASVLDFLDKEDTPGIVVGTSDHETGGLATARQLHKSYPEYLWYPGVLANASHSAERLASNYHNYLHDTSVSHDTDTDFDRRRKSDKDEKSLHEYLETQVKDGLGIHDAKDKEIKKLIRHPDQAAYHFADMISRRAQTGWSTHGHSAADVNIYSSDPATALALVGNHENTEVGEFLSNYLAVDVAAITRKLQNSTDTGLTNVVVDQDGEKEVVGWMGEMPGEDERLDGQDHLEKYQGDSKRKLLKKQKHKREAHGGVGGCDCGL